MIMPVLGSKPQIFISFKYLDEEWAMKIHDQTLERLAERGGLSYEEIVMNVERMPFSNIRSVSPSHVVSVIERLAIRSFPETLSRY